MVTADQLSQGVNIASMTADAWEPGGPWDAQSDVVKEIVDSRDRLLFASFFQMIYDPKQLERADLQQSYRKLDDGLVELERKLARPQPYRFEIKKVK